MPYFSIIIPTYNCENTISDCLNCVLEQSFYDFEILLIDGESKDSTLEILKHFNDERLLIVSEPDQGIYDAMNKGIKKAKGNWIYFLGSDDLFYDNMVLETIYKETRNDKVEVIYGNVSMNGNVYDGFFDTRKIVTRNICHQAIFYSQELLLQLNGFDLKYNILSDYDLNLKWFFSKNYRNKYVNIIIATYSTKGFSSKFIDKPFFEDLPFKFLKLGNVSLTTSEIKINLMCASKVLEKRENYAYSAVFKVLYFTIRAFDNIRRKLRFIH